MTLLLLDMQMPWCGTKNGERSAEGIPGTYILAHRENDVTHQTCSQTFPTSQHHIPQYTPATPSIFLHTMSHIPLAKSAVQLTLTSALSAYGLFLSYQNITRLQQYEKQSEKAAEWSNTAAEKLQKTRTTQASGTISVRPTLSCPFHRSP
jgi:hypothetical protein